MEPPAWTSTRYAHWLEAPCRCAPTSLFLRARSLRLSAGAEGVSPVLHASQSQAIFQGSSRLANRSRKGMVNAACSHSTNRSAQEQAHILLVGTEEGRVHRCSTALSGEAQSTYYGHSDPVYTVHWNRRHPEAFLSASADWTVKLWLSGRSEVICSADCRASQCSLPITVLCPCSPCKFKGKCLRTLSFLECLR